MTTLEPYPEYKDSGIEWLGKIPCSWSTCALGRFARFRNGADYSEVEITEGGYPVYGSGGEFRRASKYLFDGESVLFGRKGTVDKPLHVKGRFWTVDTMYFTEIDTDRLIPRFVYYWATQLPYAYWITNTALPSMTQSDLAAAKIPYIPLQDQASIVRFLDRETAEIDAFIADQEELIALLTERRAATITHTVATATAAERVPVRRVLRHIDQGWSPVCENFAAVAGEWGVLKVGCVNGGRFDAGENKALPRDVVPIPELAISRGDVLVSRGNTRELVGSAAYVPKDHGNLLISDLLYRLHADPSRVRGEFLAIALSTQDARGQIESSAKGTSASMQKISQADVLNIKIPIPTLDVQEEAVALVARETAELDAAIADAREAIALSRERRAALISAAVTGKIDVRGAV